MSIQPGPGLAAFIVAEIIGATCGVLMATAGWVSANPAMETLGVIIAALSVIFLLVALAVQQAMAAVDAYFHGWL